MYDLVYTVTQLVLSFQKENCQKSVVAVKEQDVYSAMKWKYIFKNVKGKQTISLFKYTFSML